MAQLDGVIVTWSQFFTEVATYGIFFCRMCSLLRSAVGGDGVVHAGSRRPCLLIVVLVISCVVDKNLDQDRSSIN